jgi:hypothetical protein
MADAVTRLADLSSRLEAGDFEALRGALADEYFGYSPRAGEPSAADRITDLALGFQGALPDLTASLADISTNDDGTCSATLTVRGTHTRDLWGAPGSGAAIEWTTPVTIRAVGDKFAVCIDELPGPQRVGLVRQLRLVNPADEMDLPPRYPVVIPEFLLRLVFTGEAGDRPCAHVEQIQVTEPTADVCQECVDAGDIWPALRMCLICGYVGCCDTSKNRHMARHHEETGHPIFRSINADEGWIYCYEDDAFFEKSTLSGH